MLSVDLKTIHNWVHAGHLYGRRTKGRHLRFARPTVVRFVRRFGFPIPPSLSEHLVSLIYVSGRVPRFGSRAWEHVPNLNGAALRVGGDAVEIAVVDLDSCGVDAVNRWVSAVRGFELTADVALVGVSDKPLRRRGFLATGGDLAMPAAGLAAVQKVAEWLVGGTERLPRGVEIQDD
jgi:hypothetical protein